MIMSSNPNSVNRKDARRYGILLFCLSLFFFGLIPYGGIRSSDSEVVFRVAESIAEKGVFYLQRDLEDWHAFGVATGKGDRMYAIFGPLESVLLAPIVKVGEMINETEWYKPYVSILPLSHFSDKGWDDFLSGKAPNNPKPHALRFLASVFNVIVTALSVLVFWHILLLLTGSIPASFLVSILYAVGTHAWVYAGTYFSEPLATLLVLLSFLYLVKSDQLSEPEAGKSNYRPVFLCGVWLGLAITAHITAALYAPFFALYYIWKDFGTQRALIRRLDRAAVFTFGVFILLFLLGLYNYFRFASFFETGRTASAISGEIFGYGKFVFPLVGLYGLIFGAGKGIVFFMPVLVLGVFLSKSFLHSNKQLFWIVASAVAFRVLFIAARSDWHGGFCIGPRYLVMAVPFFLIPIAFWLRDREATRFAKSFGAIAVAGLIFSIEQFYFCLCEVFTFLQLWKFQEMYVGFNVFEHDVLYLDWRYSPLVGMSRMRVAPFFLRITQLHGGDLLALGSLFLLVFFSIFFLLLLKMPRLNEKRVDG